jgi:hypothetical protein
MYTKLTKLIVEILHFIHPLLCRLHAVLQNVSDKNLDLKEIHVSSYHFFTVSRFIEIELSMI